MNTYLVQAIYGDLFEDLYVKAKSSEDAIKKATKMIKGTKLDNRWTRFVV